MRRWCGSAGSASWPTASSCATGWIVARLNGHVEEICPLSEIFLRGQHNVENVLAATACALWTGVSPAAIRAAIGRFRGVAHRIEWVRELKGVQYYNDSKGTNVASTLRALESFSERIVLIAGGKGKGQAWGPLADAARGRVAHALLIGEDAPKIGAALAAAPVPVTFCRTLQDAVDRARAVADAGRRRAALAGVRLLRHVRQLRASRRRLQEARGASRLMTRTRGVSRMRAARSGGGVWGRSGARSPQSD